MNITNNGSLMLKAYGRYYKVVHIAKSIEEANKMCEEFKHLGVLSEEKNLGLIFLCDLEDKGCRLLGVG